MPDLQKNQVVSLQIDGYTVEGAGVGHLDGFAVFVPFALSGETVTVVLIKVSKRYAVGKLQQVLESSPQRVQPPCPHFPACGGCTLLSMSYEEQLLFKQQRISDAFARIGHLPITALPVLGMQAPYRYRNKAAFPVCQQPSGPEIGLYAARSHRIIAVQDCLLQQEQTQKILSAFQQYFSQCHVQAYKEETHSGSIRHIVTRTNEKGEILLCVVTRVPLPNPQVLIELLKQTLLPILGIVQNINAQKTNVIFGEQETVLFGNPFIEISLCGLRFRVSPRSFFQVNLLQAQVLYQKALELAHLTGSELVVDAYCGVGSLSLLFAKHANQVIGIECVEPAVLDARQNAALNGISNVSFLCDFVENALPRLYEQGIRPDVLVLDPPRKGCEPAVLQAAAKCKIPRIVYVSCDPTTQARDAALLTELGYQASAVQGVDMFCQTAHVECVVLMSTVEK